MSTAVFRDIHDEGRPLVLYICRFNLSADLVQDMPGERQSHTNGFAALHGVEKTREGLRKIVIDHIEVDESLQGKGVGEKMVEAAVKFAEKNNLLIKPDCPFAKKILESSDKYEDVLTR